MSILVAMSSERSNNWRRQATGISRYETLNTVVTKDVTEVGVAELSGSNSLLLFFDPSADLEGDSDCPF